MSYFISRMNEIRSHPFAFLIVFVLLFGSALYFWNDLEKVPWFYIVGFVFIVNIIGSSN